MLLLGIGLAGCAAPAAEPNPAADTPPIRLIIRGDDVGMTQGSLAGVEKCFNEGVLTCASFIVPAPWFEAAAALAQKNPRWCVGIHLCLFAEWTGYRWKPVLPWDRVPSLVDEDGYFYPHPRDLFSRKPSLAEIDAELRAQINLAQKKGIAVQYIDTHMMSPTDQTYPGLGKIIADISRDYGLPVSGLMGEKRFGTSAEPFETKIQRTLKRIEELRPGLWLWVEHPGIDSPEQHALKVPFDDRQPYGWVARDRTNVTQLLTDPRLQEAIRRKGIRLTHYGQLRAEEKQGEPETP